MDEEEEEEDGYPVVVKFCLVSCIVLAIFLSTSKEGGEDEERFNSGTTVVEIPKGVPTVPIVPLIPLKPCRDGEATPNPVNEGENDAVVECKG